MFVHSRFSEFLLFLLNYHIAVSEIVCHSPNTTTCHHHFGDNSRCRLGLAAQKKHTTRKYNIFARVPGSTDRIWTHFLFFILSKKCAKITSVLPGTLADMFYLRVVCFLCAASPRRRRESSPKWWWQVVVFGLWQTISETAINLTWQIGISRIFHQWFSNSYPRRAPLIPPCVPKTRTGKLSWFRV